MLVYSDAIIIGLGCLIGHLMFEAVMHILIDINIAIVEKIKGGRNE